MPAAMAVAGALLAGTPARTQPPRVSPALYRGYSQMYDLDFGGAHATFINYEAGHPQDPLGPASNAAAYLFSEFDRLHILQSELFTDDDMFRHRKRPTPDPASRRAFDAEMAKTDKLATEALARAGDDANAMFASILSLGLRADYDALVEKRYMASLKGLKTGRTIAEKLLSVDPGCYDAYLAIGVENYMLSLKPAPIRWVLQLSGSETDKETGIAKLKLTAEKGTYLRPYARLLLGVAALRDGDRDTARRILQDLTREFPHNYLYSEELARLR